MSKYKNKWLLIFAVSLLISIAAVVWAFISIRHLPRYDYSIDDWKSEQAVWENNGLSVNDSLKDSGDSQEFLWGPYKPLKKGS